MRMKELENLFGRWEVEVGLDLQLLVQRDTCSQLDAHVVSSPSPSVSHYTYIFKDPWLAFALSWFTKASIIS